MELEDAFLQATRAFYAKTSHKNVDKYSKRPFQYSFDTLDEMQKQFSTPAPVEDEPEIEDNPVEEELE